MPGRGWQTATNPLHRRPDSLNIQPGKAKCNNFLPFPPLPSSQILLFFFSSLELGIFLHSLEWWWRGRQRYLRQTCAPSFAWKGDTQVVGTLIGSSWLVLLFLFFFFASLVSWLVATRDLLFFFTSVQTFSFQAGAKRERKLVALPIKQRYDQPQLMNIIKSGPPLLRSLNKMSPPLSLSTVGTFFRFFIWRGLGGGRGGSVGAPEPAGPDTGGEARGLLIRAGLQRDRLLSVTAVCGTRTKTIAILWPTEGLRNTPLCIH